MPEQVLGQNPGKFTFQGTNTFVIGTGASRILVDTSGGEPEYAALLAATLAEHGISLKYVLITHWHGDHSGGVPDLVRMWPHLKDQVYKNDPEPGQQQIVDGQIFRVEGATVRAVHAPGHSEDHMWYETPPTVLWMLGSSADCPPALFSKRSSRCSRAITFWAPALALSKILGSSWPAYKRWLARIASWVILLMGTLPISSVISTTAAKDVHAGPIDHELTRS